MLFIFLTEGKGHMLPKEQDLSKVESGRPYSFLSRPQIPRERRPTKKCVFPSGPGSSKSSSPRPCLVPADRPLTSVFLRREVGS